MKLENKIRQLINSKREENYWDFKAIPHDNKISLLHDILCMSNTLHEGNRYIIIGVSDPSKGCKIIGLTKNQLNRKSQAEIIDLLRTKKFAADIRPEIEVKTLIVEEKEIDVITIFNRPYKPYYLTEDTQYKGKAVKAYYIYTRNSDSNTPINKSADLFHVEKMWKERLGLNLTPLEKFKSLLLKPNEWFKDIGNKSYAYHRQFPEFRIEFSYPEKIVETFSYFYSNPKSFVGDAIFKYYSTTLFELEYCYVDEMRETIGYPSTGYLSINGIRNWYYYFDMSSLKGIFHYFLINGDLDLFTREEFSECILFKNKQEKDDFHSFIDVNEILFLKLKPSQSSIYTQERIEKDNADTNPNPLFSSKVKQIHEIWKEKNRP